ncbi:MAG: hypothetical protein WC180_05425 [Candidatus Paceibacterota bacterium]
MAFTIIANATKQCAAFQCRGIAVNDCSFFSNQEIFSDSIHIPPCAVSFSINLAIREGKVKQGFANLQKNSAGD